MDAVNQAGQTPVVPNPQEAPREVPKETSVAEPKDSFKKQTPVAKMTGLWKVAGNASKTLFTGFGFGSGLVGGFAIGGAIATTGNVIQALFRQSLTMAGATSAGLTGGIIGAAIFGISGALGGYQFGHAIVKGAHKLYTMIKDHSS